MIQPDRSYAEKRWGHGRLLRLGRRMLCRLTGHDYFPWHFDWPYDDWHEEMGEPRDPYPWENILWLRGCRHNCGCVETARASLDAREFLPGEVANVEDNVIRRGAGWT